EGLAGNLNALIDTERRRQARYRNTLDDLAHSLKTPLAVMRTLLGDSGRTETAEDAELIQAVDRMEERVTYQLRRARASGATGLGMEPVKVAPVLDDLKLTLDKVYRDKAISAEVAASSNVVFLGDAGDFTEIAGNIIENAYKYGRARVRVRAWNEDGSLRLTVEDDGPGISPGEAEALIERGSRADESVPGQGIGLAVVREIADLYQGQLTVGESDLGGAKIDLDLRRASYDSERM
ncbi:MAG: ATP-binding protein, partial [Gammaproteobacteria bacterium]|nr:ATP-binding protein [Gammaproteobacteria bacterium]